MTTFTNMAGTRDPCVVNSISVHSSILGIFMKNRVIRSHQVGKWWVKLGPWHSCRAQRGPGAPKHPEDPPGSAFAVPLLLSVSAHSQVSMPPTFSPPSQLLPRLPMPCLAPSWSAPHFSPSFLWEATSQFQHHLGASLKQSPVA